MINLLYIAKFTMKNRVALRGIQTRTFGMPDGCSANGVIELTGLTESNLSAREILATNIQL